MEFQPGPMSSLVVCSTFTEDGGTRAPLPREGVWPLGMFRELGGGEQDGHSGRVQGEQNSTGPVRGEKLKLHRSKRAHPW